MIPLAVPNLAGNEARYLEECVTSNFVSSVGPFVDRLEQGVAEAAGAQHAVATCSGTAGLHAALAAVGVERDDLVLLPSFTFIASANAISHCGADPWLFDVNEDSWTLDPMAVEAALETETEKRDGRLVHRASGRRVAALLPVYTLGMPADMDPIVKIARRHGLPIVADAAAALGARYRGRDIAALGAELTVFSFNGNKTVTAGGGGAVAGDDEALCARVKHLTTTARRGEAYDHDAVGFNYRMTNLQAAVGCAQLERLDALVGAKRRIARTYTDALADLDGLAAFPDPPWAESACWFSGVRSTRHPATDAVAALRQQQIGCRPFWKPIHLQKPYAAAPRQKLDRCEGFWEGILTLPCSTGLSEHDQGVVIDAVRKWAASA